MYKNKIVYLLFFLLYINSNMNQNLIKLILLVSLLAIIYRLYISTNESIETFDNHDNTQPKLI